MLPTSVCLPKSVSGVIFPSECWTIIDSLRQNIYSSSLWENEVCAILLQTQKLLTLAQGTLLWKPFKNRTSRIVCELLNKYEKMHLLYLFGIFTTSWIMKLPNLEMNVVINISLVSNHRYMKYQYLSVTKFYFGVASNLL